MKTIHLITRLTPMLLAFLLAHNSAAVILPSPPAEQAQTIVESGFQLRLKQGRASSESEAARIAQQRYGGKVLSVQSRRTDNGVVYRVKLLLEDGRVKTVTIRGN